MSGMVLLVQLENQAFMSLISFTFSADSTSSNNSLLDYTFLVQLELRCS